MLKWGLKAVLIFVFVLSTWLGGASFDHVQAVTNEIRVALFVDTGSGYRETVQSVTLSSDEALTYQNGNGRFDNIGHVSESRFRLDDFYLLVAETTDASQARQVNNALSQSGYNADLVQIQMQGTDYYRVVLGSATDHAAISQLQRQVSQQMSYNPQVAGPYRVQAGQFTSLKSAQQRLQRMQQGDSDIPAYLAQVNAGDQISYEVWMGDAANEQERQALQSTLQQSYSDMTFQPAKATDYILHYGRVITDSANVPYISVDTRSTLEVLSSETSSVPLITVEEKDQRQYRGKMELTQHNGHFTVVNVLPLESYLYSVVGTEMSTGWPIEALKAQAVMSRNYAYNQIQENKYGVAHLSDSVFEQAYHGYGREAQDVRQAVDQTSGQFLTFGGHIFATFYHSNAGGMTANGSEVWRQDLEHHNRVESDDAYPETVQVRWYRIQDGQGQIGYVSSEYIDKGTQGPSDTDLTFTFGTVNTSSLNFRAGPSTRHNRIGTLSQGARVLILDEVRQDNAYSWIAGPYTGEQLQRWINERDIQSSSVRSPVYQLEVTERGPSGRVLSMEANGQAIQTSTPDAHRSVFKDGTGNLRSTKFEVEAMGEFTVLGADGQQVDYPRDSTQSTTLYALQGEPDKTVEVNVNQTQFVAVNQELDTRILSKKPLFRLHGHGFGHGLGASQWGMYRMANNGYDYEQMLKHYFHNNVKLETKY
ncbi:SpoIID/LytB domain-containing protein [Caldalkalibacillus salinus]|uniref:SpoIID/LytB domain-containing protein n=1 Tax=Caldalkalibacillus salinus TaxID=2803787 RepID=UPI001920D3CE|nr:SpoIID/LytB domain-containing protein [Caldalkalibacillus salinus]